MTTIDKEIVEDAMRYRWLKENRLRIVPADRDGPEYPALCFTWDIMEYYKLKYNPKDRLDQAIDYYRCK